MLQTTCWLLNGDLSARPIPYNRGGFGGF